MAERSLWVLLDTSAAAVGHNQIAQGCLSRNYTTQIALPGGLLYKRYHLSLLSSLKKVSGIMRKLWTLKGTSTPQWSLLQLYIIKWSIGSNLTDCNDYLEVSIKLCPEESPSPCHSPTIMNKRVQWEVKARPALLLLQKREKKKNLLFCFSSSSCSLSLSPTSSSFHSLLWFMVAIHLQAASITSSLLGDHGSSCVLWEGFGRPTPKPDFIPFTPDSTLHTVPVFVPATSYKPNPSFRPEPILYSQLYPKFELLMVCQLFTLGFYNRPGFRPEL